MNHLSLPILAGISAASAALVWVAGIQLSNTTDEIDAHFGLGQALGGIAIQTVVLVALDGFGVPRRPLTNATASLVQVLEGALVMAVLAVAMGATLLPRSIVVGRVDPSALLIVLFWVGGLWLVRRAGNSLPWKTTDTADTSRRRRAGARKPRATWLVLAIFGAAGVATLLAGIGLEEFLNLGPDSLVVVLLYAVGIAGMVVISRA